MFWNPGAEDKSLSKNFFLKNGKVNGIVVADADSKEIKGVIENKNFPILRIKKSSLSSPNKNYFFTGSNSAVLRSSNSQEVFTVSKEQLKTTFTFAESSVSEIETAEILGKITGIMAYYTSIALEVATMVFVLFRID